MNGTQRAGPLATAGFYIYATPTILLPALGTASENILIENDAHFDWHYGSFSAFIAATSQQESTRILPYVLVNMFTQDNARFSNVPLPLPSWFGDGRLPMQLPFVRRFRPQAKITIELTNRVATAYEVYVLLIGKKVYPR